MPPNHVLDISDYEAAGAGGGSPVSIPDGGNIVEGALADAAVSPGSVGSISAKLRQISSDIAALIPQSTDFWPIYNRKDLGGGPPRTDPAGATLIRGAVTTDEGAGRANFTGSSIFVTPAGNATFTNGSATVTGTGFAALDLHYLDFVKLNADASSAWAQAAYIESDTEITLLQNYTGTGGTGAWSYSQVSSSAGTGQTVTVASGQATIALGATTAAQAYISKGTTSAFMQMVTSLSISQRVANQNVYVGLESTLTAPKQFARFNFTSTVNTSVITETGYNPTTTPSAAEMETNTVTIPASGTSATLHTYRIEQLFDKVAFYIDDVLVATHTKRIPHSMTEGSSFLVDGGTTILGANIRGLNGTTPTTGTSVVVDYLYARCYDRLDVYQNVPTDTQPVSVTGTVIVDDLAAAPTGAAVPANAQYQGSIAQTALPAPATAGNLAGTFGDRYGRQVVIGGTLRDLIGVQPTTITASTTETTIVPAIASTFNDIKMIYAINTSAATASRIDFRDTTGGPVLFSLQPSASGAPQGFNLGDSRLPQTAVNTNWTAQCSVAATDVRIFVVYEKNK